MRNTKSHEMSQSRNRGSSNLNIRFSKHYALVSLMMFVVLVFIAGYVRDSFIRPTFGDVLVVVWLYYTIASVIRINPKVLAMLVVGIATLVELSQYFQLAQWLGIEPSSLLYVVLGATFDWKDSVAYGVGGALCVVLESGLFRRDGALSADVKRGQVDEPS
ncbi:MULTISPECIES: DUF2809 domain-containing protein [unclassified Vibrio]|uniref:ribosomal maturation YjgA family protein n=1 Tax=unclassified Vibrio TaxID=2614977 RepID=UPI0012A8DE24|nr:MULTISPECIES: DUF2809 domain-containing protein [unclassified Vibrio]QFT38408.1 hypothetical protein FIU99_18750 [Vibrio sp. THAF64]QGM37054.1 hypothetical protein GGC04_22480 [Vibrio sp. THAF191d]QGN72395.1 hypothetical protein GGC03_21700 [Vibrio sp. THAF191c]